MKHIILRLSLLALFIFVLVSAGQVVAGTGAGKSLQDWTGKHSRLVWVQDQGDGSDTFARSKNLALYGYDSLDGKGERLLVNGNRNFYKPIFTPDGQKVIFSDRRDRQMFVLDWDSGKVEKLGSGVAVAVWKDTKTSFFLKKSTLWVYCFDGLQPENTYGTGQPLYRFPLGKPKKKELIWDKSNMAWSNVQLSRDGEVLGGLFPWPHGGFIHPENKEFKRLGRGCWTSLSPDNSKLLWIFDGLHRNIQIHDLEKQESWKVNINSAPGVGGFEVYHPRWSNHSRYFVITGPYEKGEGGNKLRGGGEKVEVYVGRFDRNVKKVEDWIQVTNNKRADFYPDLWVDGGGEYSLSDQEPAETVKKDSLAWPLDSSNVLYVWEDMKASNQLAETSPVGFYQCNLTLRGKALFTRDLTLNTSGGWGDTGDAGAKIGMALAKSKQVTFEIVATPDKVQKGEVISLQGSEGSRLSIQQNGDSLIVENSVAQKDTQRLYWDGVFSAHEISHLVISVYDGQMEVFRNAKSLGTKKIHIDFSLYNESQLILGDSSGNWDGTLAQIALYQVPLTPRQLETNSRYAFNKYNVNKPVQRLVVEASLLETTEIPAPDSIGAYRRALVVNSYGVDTVVEGEYAEEKIVIAEWAVLDRQIVKKYSDDVMSERLVLELFDDHPELEGERQMMDIFEPDLSMYYRLN
ncbi:LamG-like jellyroll fold domain-containing protein [Desulforhopalus sp. 52FAK]